MHLAAGRHVVAAAFQPGRPYVGGADRVEWIGIVEHAGLVRRLRGHEAGARRTADGRLAVGGMKRRGRFCEAIEVWHLKRLAKDISVLLERDGVVEAHEEDVLFLFAHLGMCSILVPATSG